MLHLLLPIASAAPVVAATGDLTCAVYVHAPPGHAPVPLVLTLGGTGLNRAAVADIVRVVRSALAPRPVGSAGGPPPPDRGGR